MARCVGEAPLPGGGPCGGVRAGSGGAPGNPAASHPVSLLQAGKFNIIPTIINVGSGVALMGVVSTSPLPLTL